MSFLARINLKNFDCCCAAPWVRKHVFPLLVSLALLPLAAPSFAAPWIETSDERTRHHLTVLADRGVITTPISTWPLMWSNIKSALDQVDPKQLSAGDVWSYQYLKHELRRQMQDVTLIKQFHVSNENIPLTDFSTDSREKGEALFALDLNGDQWAGRLQVNYAHDPGLREKHVRYDGSHLSYLLGNWAVGVGSLDRWWGPGWHSSMILSDNARPIPGIFVQRNKAKATDLPLIKYLGPWQLVTFMSQMESSREDYSRPKLWGMRVNFRPIPSLEIGLSRTAMWGGEGRPEDLNTFFDLLIGHDNRGDNDTTIENEPGNQLGGIDFRWNFSTTNWSGATYAQLIGEDEANGMPSRHIGMAGLEFNTHTDDAHWRLTVEAHNSQVYFYDGNKNGKNVAYGHSIYTDGYRYYGRSLGAATDNDTESVFAGLQAYLSNGHAINLSIANHRLNYDDSGSSKNAFGTRAQNTMEYKGSYSLPVSDHYALKIGAIYYSDELVFQGQERDLAGYFQLNGRW